MTGNIDINLRNKIGKGGNGGNRNSLKNKRETIKNSKSSNKVGIEKIRAAESVKYNQEMMAMFAPVIAGVAIASKVANKGIDLYAKYQTGKTGQTVHYSNIKATKDMVLSGGMNYVKGWINNEIFTKKAIERQNSTLEYDRQIYNLNNYGIKLKTR